MRDPFNIQTEKEFKAYALELFAYQHQNNKVYRQFCDLLKVDPSTGQKAEDIPYLPIEFFKLKKVYCGTPGDFYFSSSGTTSSVNSKHYIEDLNHYTKSFRTAFNNFYGPINDYCVLALLPSYLEREGSSLIYMAEDLIKESKHPQSGFYLNEFDFLAKTLKELESKNTKTLLIGVSFALLDFVEEYQIELHNTIVMETGGMKGRRKELIRAELHELLKEGFGVNAIHSEYGMTELLSQAYSKGNGLFKTPPWMKISIRDTRDPLSLIGTHKTGGINIIDLANKESCAFIATEDLGKVYPDGSFEVLGRFDKSAIRGCNLMVMDPA